MLITDHTNLIISDLIYDSENNIYKIISIYADGLITGYNKDKDYCKFFSNKDSIHGISLTKQILLDNKIPVTDFGFCYLNDVNLKIYFYKDHISLLDFDHNVIRDINCVHEVQYLLKFIYPNGQCYYHYKGYICIRYMDGGSLGRCSCISRGDHKSIIYKPLSAEEEEE